MLYSLSEGAAVLFVPISEHDVFNRLDDRTSKFSLVFLFQIGVVQLPTLDYQLGMPAENFIRKFL